MTDKPVAEMNFEDAIKELEDIVGKLEDSEVALDDSIALYTRGEALKKHCEAKLSAAQEKVDRITLTDDGTPDGLKPVQGA